MMWLPNAVALAGIVLVLGIQVSTGQNTDVGEKAPTDHQVPSIDPEQRSGRSLLDFGIFRKLSKLFGWGTSNQKSTRKPTFYRRREMVPFEVLNSNNRRSDRPLSTNLIKRRNYVSFLPNRRAAERFEDPAFGKYSSIPNVKRHYRNPSSGPVSLSEDSYTPFKPFKSNQRNAKENSLTLDQEQIKHSQVTKSEPLPPEDPRLQQPEVEMPMVESREPVVTVNKVLPKGQFFAKEKQKQKKETIHSKFALKTYSPNHETPEGLRPFKKNDFKTPPTTARLETWTKPITNDLDRITVPSHPYEFVDPFAVTSPTEGPHEQEFPIQRYILEPVLSKPTKDGFIPSRKPQKEKGIMENVSNFASNLFDNFGNFLSRSTKPKGHFKRHQSPPANGLSPPRNNLIPGTTFSKDVKHGDRHFFAPSPQQGIIAADAFQPIFVPSHSMNGKLPHDIMKPLIIPQNRKSEKVPQPSEPELINFF